MKTEGRSEPSNLLERFISITMMTQYCYQTFGLILTIFNKRTHKELDTQPKNQKLYLNV